ncbi:MAG: DoxX family membrane protein [Bacillota bacterium]
MNTYLNEVRNQLKDWKIASLVTIFTVVRIIYGWAWLNSGLGKLSWLNGGAPKSAGLIQVMVNNLAGPEVSKFDPLMINKMFAWVSQNIFLGMPGVTDIMVVIVEIGIGIGMLLGIKVFWVALGAMFMNVQFMAAGSFNNFGYIWTNLAFLNFAKHAELLGLSGYFKYAKSEAGVADGSPTRVNQKVAGQTAR